MFRHSRVRRRFTSSTSLICLDWDFFWDRYSIVRIPSMHESRQLSLSNRNQITETLLNCKQGTGQFISRQFISHSFILRQVTAAAELGLGSGSLFGLVDVDQLKSWFTFTLRDDTSCRLWFLSVRHFVLTVEYVGFTDEIFDILKNGPQISRGNPPTIPHAQTHPAHDPVSPESLKFLPRWFARKFPYFLNSEY